MKERSTKAIIVLDSSLAALVVWLVSVSLVTKIIFSVLVWLSVAVVLGMVMQTGSDEAEMDTSSIREALSWIDILVYACAILSSVCILTLPLSILSFGSFADLIVSAGFQGALRILSGIYLATLFPGYSIVAILEQHKPDVATKLLITILLSFAVVSALAMLLFEAALFSVSNLVGSIWAVTLLFGAYVHVTRRRHRLGSTFVNRNMAWKGSRSQVLLLAIPCVLTVLSSYLVTFFTEPMRGIMSGDVTPYAVFASDLFSDIRPVLAPYIGLGSYLVAVGRLTGLPFAYAYVAVQVLTILFPLSVYLLGTTLASGNKLVGSMSAFMVTVIQGLPSIVLLGALITNPVLLGEYLGGGANHVIRSVLYLKIGWGYSTLPNGMGLFVAWLEIAILLTGAAFILRYLWTDESVSLFMGAFLVATMIFVHNFLLLSVMALTLLVYALLTSVRVGRLVRLVVLTISFVLALDFAYGQWLIHYLTYKFNIFGTGLGLILLLTMGVGFIVSLTLIHFGTIHNEWLALRQDRLQRSVFSLRSGMASFSGHLRIADTLSKGCVRLGLVVILAVGFVVSMVMEYESFSIVNVWTDDTFVYPWWIFASRLVFHVSAVIILIPSLLAQRTTRANALSFLTCWIVSTFPVALSALIVPEMLAPSLWTNRLLMFLILPLSFMVALAFDEWMKRGNKIGGPTRSMPKLRNATTRHVVAVSITLMISLSVLSVSSAFDFYSIGSIESHSSLEGTNNRMMANLDDDDVVMSLSDETHNYLSLFTSQRVAPSTRAVTESMVIHEELLSLPTQFIESFLGAMDVNYILLTPSDIEGINQTVQFDWLSKLQKVYTDAGAEILLLTHAHLRPRIFVYDGNHSVLLNGAHHITHRTISPEASTEQLNIDVRLYYEGELVVPDYRIRTCYWDHEQSELVNETYELFYEGAVDTVSVVSWDIEYKGHQVVINNKAFIDIPLTGNNRKIEMKIPLPSIWLENNTYPMNQQTWTEVAPNGPTSIYFRNPGQYLVVLSRALLKTPLETWFILGESQSDSSVSFAGPFNFMGLYAWLVNTTTQATIRFDSLPRVFKETELLLVGMMIPLFALVAYLDHRRRRNPREKDSVKSRIPSLA